MLHKVIHEPPQPLDLPREEPSLAMRIDDTIRHALSKSPRDRFATAAEFALALTGAVGDPARTVVNLHPAPAVPAPKAPDAPAPATSTRHHVALATRLTPALAIYLLDLSGSMGLPLDGRTRIDLVKEALTKTIERMVFRSTRGVLVSPRYRVAVLGYSDRVYDLLSGIKSVDRLAAESFDPGLVPLSTTDTARGFAEVEKLLHAELPRLQDCPAPIVCHLTDGESTGDDPEPIVERIKAMKVADGNVLVENVFISKQVLSGPMADVKQWSGVTRETLLATPYADKLRRMSSPLPDSYRSGLNDFGFNPFRGGHDAARHQSRAGKLAFQMSGMTGVASVT